MNVLLIGGSGFLGRHLATALAAAGHRITTLSRGTVAAVAEVEALIADRRDPAALAAALDGRRFDLTVDLAAWEASDVERLYFGPRVVLGRYVLISSGQVYLVTRAERTPYREEDNAAPLIEQPASGSADLREWRYGIGKRLAEGALLSLRASHGVRGMILRLPVMVGEGDTSLRIWAYLERLLDGGPMLLPDRGQRPTRFLDARDVGAAVVTLAENDWPARPVFNLAQPEIVPIRDVLARMAEVAGAAPEWVSARWDEIESAGLPRSISPWAGPWVSVLDPARAVEWGFRATSIEDWLPRVVRWHLENRPPKSHPGYEHRAAEVAFARQSRAA